MALLSIISFDDLLLSLMAVLLIRDAMLKYLPPSMVGPEGWLLRVDRQH